MVDMSMSNIQANLHAPEPRLTQNLKKLFVRLVDPREDANFVETYARSIRDEFIKSLQEIQEAPHFSPFAKACMRAGIVKTMMTVARKEWSGPRVSGTRYSAQSHAFECLFELMRTGDADERRDLLGMMLQEEIVSLCFRYFVHPEGIMRQVAVSTLHILSSESFLGECISPTTAADILEAVCLLTLRERGNAVAKLIDPVTGKTRILRDGKDMRAEFMNRLGNPPRFDVMDLEEAMRTAHGILCTSPPQPRKFCHDILKTKPRIIDLVLDCAILDRPQWNPETQVDSMACATLALLFAWPPHIVPGMATPTDKAFKTQEWTVMSQTLEILTSRPDWSERLIEIWMRTQEEDIKQIRSYFDHVERDYGTFSQLANGEGFKMIFKYRGICKVTVLRLIATLTHAAETCGITNAQLESFLHIAYLSSRKVKAGHECTAEEDMFIAIENEQEMLRAPSWTISLGVTPQSPMAVGPESILGPTALIRLLVTLARRNALESIQRLQTPPAGLSSSTSLDHIQQITHPDVIRRTIGISQARLRARIDAGRHCVATKEIEADWDIACAAFTSSAELAAALVALDTHTDGMYKNEVRGARRQLVIALGNASQMALNLKQYQRALHYGWGAVTAAENIPAEEGLDPWITEKNKRRVNHADAGLQL